MKTIYPVFSILLVIFILQSLGFAFSKDAQLSNYRITTEVGGTNSRGVYLGTLSQEDTIISSVDVPILYHQTTTPKQVACGINGEMYILDSQSIRIINITDCNPQPTDIIQNYVSSLSSKIYYKEGYRLDVILSNPFGFAIHPVTGELYIPQFSSHNIFKVSKETGMLSIFFGSTSGSSLTTLNSPKGVNFDPKTLDLLVADSGNSRILRINPNGIATLVAGSPGGSTADNVDAKTAQISSLAGVLVLSLGDIYYSENGKIRKISNSIVSTVLSDTGLTGYISLSANEKRIYYCSNNNVFALDLQSKISTKLAGTSSGVNSGDGGLAVSAALQSPSQVFENKHGDLFISCTSLIRKVFANGTIITAFGKESGYKFSGNDFPKSVVPVYGRPSLALNQTSGELHFFDASRMLRKVSSDGIVRKIIGVMTGSTEEGTATLVQNGPVGPGYKFDTQPTNIVINRNAFYIFKTGKIQKLENYYYSTFLNIPGIAVNPVSSCPTIPSQLIKFNETENCLYYVYQSKSIVMYNITTGKSTAIVNPAGYVGIQSTLTYRTSATFANIKIAIMNSKGEIFLQDCGTSNYIKKLQLDGYVSVYAGSTTGDISDVVPTSAKFSDYINALVYNEKNGDLLIGDTGNFKVKKISGGTVKVVAGGGTSTLNNVVATTAKLTNIYGMDLTLNSEIILYDGATTTGNRLVFKVVYPNGTLSFLETSFTSATSIQCIKAKSLDDIYVSSNTVIVRITNRVNVTILAGNTVQPTGIEVGDPVKGDGGDALQNKVNPKTFDISSNGDIYVYDFGPASAIFYYTRIRKISNGIITTLIGFDTGPLCKTEDVIYTYFNSISKGGQHAIYANDNIVNRILRIDTDTSNVNTSVGVGGSTYIGEGLPRMVNVVPLVSFYLESTGELYFAESNRVRKLKSDGMTELVAGTGSGSFSITTTGSKATTTAIGAVTCVVAYKTTLLTYVYIVSSTRISVVKNGEIYLIAGSYYSQSFYTQTLYFAGEGSDAKSAYFEPISQLEVNAKGEIFIPELGRIRKLAPYCEDQYFLDDESFLCYWYCYGDMMNSSNACSSRGSCDSPNVCSCDQGFTGDRCENVECPFGWYGASCNITSCNTIMSDDNTVCSGNGNCYDVDTCNCSAGYSGIFCDSFSCFGIASTSPITCLGNGTCVGFDKCSCHTGYFGSHCDIISCFSIRQDNISVCSSNGQCIGMDKCQCNSGYYGEQCNITSCYGIRQDNTSVCSSNGFCNSFNSCLCYYGENCQYVNNSNSNNITNSSTIFCFDIASTNSSVCSGAGLCVSTNHCKCNKSENTDVQCRNVGTNTSVPYNNDTNNDTELPLSCFGKFANDSEVCSGRGQCLAHDNCSCISSLVSHISGNICQDIFCHDTVDTLVIFNSSNVCSSNGVCTTLGCICNESYTGIACQEHDFTCYEVSKNNRSVCSGNGICVSRNNCSCFDGFYGNNCEFSVPGIVRCFGIPSYDRGVKHALNIFAMVSALSNNVCSSHGVCSSPNKCNCTIGYTGLDCNIPICNNILANETKVCSNSSGKCISPNYCFCENGYSGNECEIPICFGKLANYSDVCNGLGVCTAPNNCECKTGSPFVIIDGSECQYLQCLGSENKFINSKHNEVCNMKGTCEITGCKCLPGYYGDYCQLYTCGGILFNQSNVCSGNGNCTDFDTCSCAQNSRYGFWKGSNCNICREDYETEVTGCKNPKCDNSTCNNHGYCNSNLTCICNGNWDGIFCSKCKENYFGFNCEIFCEKKVSCSNNGECTSNGTCSCYSNSKDGFWEGTRCHECKPDYYGSQCSTQIIGPAKFLDMYNGIIFKINGPVTYTQSMVECSRLISNSDLAQFGTEPSCSWTNRSSGEFTILFGDGYTLTAGSIVKMNRLVFDSGTDLQDVIILNAENPIIPIVVLSGLSNIGTCDNFTLDASKSYSGDRKPLIYNWSIISSPNNVLSMILSNSSVLTLDYITLLYPGEYIFGLQVKSSISGKSSVLNTWSVFKASIPLPVVTIIGFNERTIIKNESPVVIKKHLELPVCFYENQELKIVWQQLSGPNTTFESDWFNNLAITHFYGLVEAVYEFKVTATSVFNPESFASDTIKIVVRPSPLHLILYGDEVSSDIGTIVVDYTDPDSTSETEIWKWSCRDYTNNVGCGSIIDDALAFYGNNRAIRFPISSTDLKSYSSMPTLLLTLSISKGIRNVEFNLDFKFPESAKVPPTVTLISFLPSKSVILKQDIVNLQLAVTANGESVGIDPYIVREWSLNSMILKSNNSLLSMMDINPSFSNSIVINPSSLEDSSTYTVTLKVTDIRNSLSASYSQSFTMATLPQACPCTILPVAGIALETSFSFTCINCQNVKKTLNVVYGFIDDKSGANIPLYQQGETYSTKLPCSYTPLSNKIVTTYIRITDTSTGAFREIRKDITIDLAPVKSVVEVKKKIAGYSTIQNSLKDGDIAKMVFNSATISRVADGMLTKVSTGLRRNLQLNCQNGGIYNTVTNRCTCLSGYSKEDCSLTTTDFTAFKEIRLALMNEFIDTFKARNPYEIISETYLTLQVYGLDSLIEKYDEIDEHSIEKSYSRPSKKITKHRGGKIVTERHNKNHQTSTKH